MVAQLYMISGEFCNDSYTHSAFGSTVANFF